MKKTALLTLLFYSIITNLHAQDQQIFERLHSTKIESSIFVEYDGTTFSYVKKLNDLTPINIGSDKAKIFQISNDDENNLKIYIKFYNPLRYKIKFKSSEISDSYYTAINEFINSLPSDIAFNNSNTVSSPSNYTPGGRAGAAAKAKFVKLNRLLNSMPDSSPILQDWVVLFRSNVDTNKSTDPLYSVTLENKINTINKIKNIEEFTFDKIDLSINRVNDSKLLNDWIKNVHSTLNIEKIDYGTFNNNLKRGKEIYKKLEQEIKEKQNELNDLVKLLENDVTTLQLFLKNDKELHKSFQALSLTKLNEIVRFLKPSLEKHKSSLDKLNGLLTQLESFVLQFQDSPKGYKKVEDTFFPWKSEKGKQYNFTAESLSDGVADKEKPEVKVEIKVFKSQGSLAVFPSVGLLYSPFEYKNYGLSEGSVAETQGDPLYFRPVAYLNFLYKPKNGDILYPMLQVGITQGIKTPIFPIGGGFSIRDKFSITGGTLLAMQNELDKLSIGDMVDDATLQDDLTTRIRFSWYISINYKIGK